MLSCRHHLSIILHRAYKSKADQTPSPKPIASLVILASCTSISSSTMPGASQMSLTADWPSPVAAFPSSWRPCAAYPFPSASDSASASSTSCASCSGPGRLSDSLSSSTPGLPTPGLTTLGLFRPRPSDHRLSDRLSHRRLPGHRLPFALRQYTSQALRD